MERAEAWTPLTDLLGRVQMLAGEMNLLCPRDVEALSKLAALNQAQQRCDETPPESEVHKQADAQFSVLLNFLQMRNYPVHRDEETHLWRLGTYQGRKD